MLCAVRVSKFPEGHPAHTAVTWGLSYSQPGLGCWETPGKTQPGLGSTRSHLASASCTGHCSQWNTLKAAIVVTQGSTSPALTPQNISLGGSWFPETATGYTGSRWQDIGVSFSCAQKDLSQRDLSQSLMPSASNVRDTGASGQHLCRESPGSSAAPQDL